MDNYEELLKRLQKISINDIYYENTKEDGRKDEFLITFNESSFDVDFTFNQINSYTNGEPIGKNRRNFQMLKEELNELGFFPKTLDINHEKVLLTNQEIKLKEEFIKYLSELEEKNELDDLDKIEKFFESDLEANIYDNDLDDLLLSIGFNRTSHMLEIEEDYPELKKVYDVMSIVEEKVFKTENNEYRDLTQEDMKLFKETLISSLDLSVEIKTLEERKERI